MKFKGENAEHYTKAGIYKFRVIRKGPLGSSGNSQLNAESVRISQRKQTSHCNTHTHRNIACNIHEAILFYAVLLEVSAEVQCPLKVPRFKKEVV